MRIAVGSDHRGFVIKGKIVELLKRLQQEVIDVGPHTAESVDYPDIAQIVGGKVSDGVVDRGILICGTGIGMCIAANKFPGVRAAPCHDDLTAEMSRRHNDLNVLCLAAESVNDQQAAKLLDTFLAVSFDGGRHAKRVAKIADLESKPLAGNGP